MGIFSNSSDDERARSLATRARGESVTAERLTKTEGGLMQKDLLASEPVIAYLNPEEQPEHFFYNDTKGVTRNGVTVGGGNDANYRSLCIVTGTRVLFFTAGSKGEALPVDAVSTANANSGNLKHRLTINTPDHEYTFYINNSIDGDEVQASAEYLEALNSEGTAAPTGTETSVIEGLSLIWGNELDETPTSDDALNADPQGGYVTKDRFEKVKGILDPDEKVHFITRGSTVDVEGSSAGESLFGDDRSRKSGTRGWVRAVITDKRIAVKIPQV